MEKFLRLNLSICHHLKYYDIHLIYNIFSELRYWQVICNRNSVKFGADFEHIFNFTVF